ncbi:MAG: HD domain-containing protein [Actinomycetota bacterium]|jgi:HD superfamily phosphohydrolase|nr:HD domain-containing protein [Actinomycetota bacterium]
MSELLDDVYGLVTVTGGLLTDLLNSRAVQRLERISQAGASSLVREGRSVTRYEHSVGVMNLVARLGGSETEQAAGLLQDVSHTAFSHTVDYVFGDRQEEFHERIFKTVVERSDIPSILASHGLTWHQLFAPHNLIRVDVPSPLLCADRIDYTLRDLVRFRHISVTEAQAFVESLEFKDNNVVIVDKEQAWAFVEWYNYLVSEIFMNPLELYAHDELARIIREGLKLGVLLESDLLGTDDLLVGKLMSDKNNRLAKLFKELKNTQDIIIGEVSEARRVHSKARVIDPLVARDGDVVPLSILRPEVRLLSTDIRRKAREGILIKRKE